MEVSLGRNETGSHFYRGFARMNTDQAKATQAKGPKAKSQKPTLLAVLEIV
jgi:hypothetical protein